ncbi:MAG: hypothetical protein LBO00_05135 [Zoogloeaceae bacterium]|jgi:hypothetical protein|nr:hypothetical protein [Zoogloeaceae bacterium]
MPTHHAPLQQFASAIREKFSTQVTGEPEEQLRAPFEQLLRDAGHALGMTGIVPIGETLLKHGVGRPERNAKSLPVKWQFSIQDARRKLARLYPYTADST